MNLCLALLAENSSKKSVLLRHQRLNITPYFQSVLSKSNKKSPVKTGDVV
jgi:hypothetical protein